MSLPYYDFFRNDIAEIHVEQRLTMPDTNNISQVFNIFFLFAKNKKKKRVSQHKKTKKNRII